MLNQPTLEKLQIMKLHGMAEAFRTQLGAIDTGQLSFEERFGLLVDQQWLWKENRALARRLRAARLKEKGVVEDIDYQHPRGLDRKLLRTLATSEWVRQHQHILLFGPTGIGKTWLACALAQKACRDGFTILHKRAAELFRDLAVAHVDGSLGRLLLKLARVDILVLDDFCQLPLYLRIERHSITLRANGATTLLANELPGPVLTLRFTPRRSRYVATASGQAVQRDLFQNTTDSREKYPGVIPKGPCLWHSNFIRQ